MQRPEEILLSSFPREALGSFSQVHWSQELQIEFLWGYGAHMYNQVSGVRSVGQASLSAQLLPNKAPGDGGCSLPSTDAPSLTLIPPAA